MNNANFKSSLSSKLELLASGAAGLKYRSQVTGQVTGPGHRSRSQVTGHRSQVTGHRSQVTGHRSQ